MISGGDRQARAVIAVAAEDKEDDMRIHIALTLALAMILGLACPQAAARAAEEGSYAATAEIAAETEEEIYAEAGAAVEEAVPETVEEEILAEIPEEAGATAEEAAIDETEAEALEAAEAYVPQNGIPAVIIEIDESDGNNTIADMNASEDHSGRGAGEPGAGRPRVYPRAGTHYLGIPQEALQDQTGQKGRRARARREQALGAPCELSG